MKYFYIFIVFLIVSLSAFFLYFNFKSTKPELETNLPSSRVTFIKDNKMFIYDTVTDSVLNFDKEIVISSSNMHYQFSNNRNLLYINSVETGKSYIYDIKNLKVKQVFSENNYIFGSLKSYTSTGEVLFSPDGKNLAFTSFIPCAIKIGIGSSLCGSVFGFYNVSNNFPSILYEDDYLISIGIATWSSDSKKLVQRKQGSGNESTLIFHDIESKRNYKLILDGYDWYSIYDKYIKIYAINPEEFLIFISGNDFSKIWRYNLQSKKLEFVKDVNFVVFSDQEKVETASTILKSEKSEDGLTFKLLDIAKSSVLDIKIPNSAGGNFISANGEKIIYQIDNGLWIYDINTALTTKLISYSNFENEIDQVYVSDVVWLGNNENIFLFLEGRGQFVLDLKTLKITQVMKNIENIQYLYKNKFLYR